MRSGDAGGGRGADPGRHPERPGVVATGALYFAKTMIFNREVLEVEPDGGAAVGAVPERTGGPPV